MAIPNTTPTPNIIFNGLMAKMTDTEFRIVMVVVRSTLGWEIDHKTGMRKAEDWISHSQLIKKTGRSGRAISTAIDNCIKRGWIEARDSNGTVLNTKAKRVGKKIFYRLGKEILLKNDGDGVLVKEYKPLKKVQRLSQTSENISTTSENSSIENSSAYKRNTITKENIQKSMSSEKPDDGLSKKEFSFREKLKLMFSDKKRHLHIIALYWKHKGFEFDNAEQYQAALRRDLRPARQLAGYSDDEIVDTFSWLDDEEYLERWTLETAFKYIDEVRARSRRALKDVENLENQ